MERSEKTCEYCKANFIPKDSYGVIKQRFCCRSCSCRAEPRRKKYTFLCKNCGKSSIGYRSKFCSTECSHDYIFKNKTLPLFKNGKISNRKTLKNIISKIIGYKCSCCGINTWLSNKLSIELDHIDGNCTNNMPNNLRLLCPNCHSQTDTWKARNKGNGRGSRGMSLG